ncbi:MAG: sigma-70 family RNA polymerase sigma factor [Bacillota bacterium]|nr:sigma-70 family RNA polymerase sigma factor [Bacillota bacterium]
MSERMTEHRTIGVEAATVVELHERLIYSVLHAMLPGWRARPDADDLVQEGRLALWRAAHHYQADRAAWSTYAVAAIRRAILRWLERHRETGLSLNATAPETGTEIEDLIPSLHDVEAQVEARLAWEAAAPETRMAAMGYEGSEIAAALGLRYRSTANRRIRQDRRRLAAMLGRDYRVRYPQRLRWRKITRPVMNVNELAWALRQAGYDYTEIGAILAGVER